MASTGWTRAGHRPFNWPAKHDLKTLKVGYFETPPAGERGGRGGRGGAGATSDDTLQLLRKIGVQLVPIKLPSKYPVNALNSS